MGERYSFTSKLVRFGTRYGVDVPAAVSRATGKARVPVEVRVARGAPFRATLQPAGGGRHRLLLNGEVRSAAGLEPGDRVALEARVDRGPREVAIPPDLTEALRDAGGKEVLEAWASLPPGKREHILKWISSRPPARRRARSGWRAPSRRRSPGTRSASTGSCDR